MDASWRGIIGGWLDQSLANELEIAVVVVLLAIVSVAWLYRRQRHEYRLRRKLEQQLGDLEVQRQRADRESSEHRKTADALRDSEARHRALAMRMTRLQSLTAALSQAVTPDAVAKAVVEHGKPLLGAQAGSVMRLSESGTQLVRLHADGDSRAMPEASRLFDLESGLCSTEAITTKRPVFVGSFANWQERCSRSAAVAGDAGYESAAVLPLLVEGGAWGVLAFHFTAPVNFDDDYQRLLIAVAHNCAEALDRARLYEAEQRTRAEAEASNRSKDEFLSTVSHELRTPLNAILGWASMLRGGSLDARGTSRAVHVIYENAQRQRQLIDDLLDLSRMITGRTALEFQEVDLGTLIKSAVESVLPQAETKGLELRFDRRATVRMRADAKRLEQVFLNLLTNAVKFTPPGGRIDVEMTCTDRTAEVRVSDTGIGIEPAFLPYVFDPFRQADSHSTRAHGGLGLGLSIAKRLVDAHEGSIRVESLGVDKGSTFIVSVPMVGSRAEASRTPALERPATPDRLPDLRGARVLAVDDDADAREILLRAFERCNASVTTAASAAEAMDLLAKDDFDALLVDIAMPGENGYTFIRKVRALPSPKASVAAAALTAYAREDQRQEALTAGFQMHVAKPIDPVQLAWSVATLLRNRAPRRSA